MAVGERCCAGNPRAGSRIGSQKSTGPEGWGWISREQGVGSSRVLVCLGVKWTSLTASPSRGVAGGRRGAMKGSDLL
eukprot:426106-Hanusia_phi.AAC.1